MKVITLITMILLSLKTFAAKSRHPIEQEKIRITFHKGKSAQKFTLYHDGKSASSGYRLKLDTEPNSKSKTVTENQFYAIRSEIVNIDWLSNYKSPRHSHCTPYLDINLGYDHSTVCAENSNVSGRAYGLVSSLKKMFQNGSDR